jgi:hypothetical protein
MKNFENESELKRYLIQNVTCMYCNKPATNYMQNNFTACKCYMACTCKDNYSSYLRQTGLVSNFESKYFLYFYFKNFDVGLFYISYTSRLTFEVFFKDENIDQKSLLQTFANFPPKEDLIEQANFLIKALLTIDNNLIFV